MINFAQLDGIGISEMKKILNSLLIMTLLGAMAVAPGANAQSDAPPTSPEGLKLIEGTELSTVYWRDGATLDIYTKVVLFDAYVAFRKNWDRQYNANLLPGSTRIRPSDMEEIKASLAAEFKSVFTEELETKRGYQIVDVAGYDTLVVKPAIINLDIKAPQGLRGTSLDSNYVTTAGSMTLFMELYDSVTGELIGRVIDHAKDNRNGFAFRATASANRVAARKILSAWAGVLGDNLGVIEETSSWKKEEQ